MSQSLILSEVEPEPDCIDAPKFKSRCAMVNIIFTLVEPICRTIENICLKSQSTTKRRKKFHGTLATSPELEEITVQIYAKSLAVIIHRTLKYPTFTHIHVLGNVYPLEKDYNVKGVIVHLDSTGKMTVDIRVNNGGKATKPKGPIIQAEKVEAEYEDDVPVCTAAAAAPLNNEQ